MTKNLALPKIVLNNDTKLRQEYRTPSRPKTKPINYSPGKKPLHKLGYENVNPMKLLFLN